MNSNRMNSSVLCAAAVLVAGMSYGSLAVASSAGCTSHVSANIMGEEIDHRDCVQNVSQPDEVFRQGCEETAKLSDSMAAEGMPDVEIHAQSTEYVAGGCPANPQASCNGMNNGVNFLYWQRSTAELAPMKQACEALGGTWQE